MVNWVLVGDASNGVLAGAYGVVAVLFLLSHGMRRLPKTGTIRNFLIFLVLLCIFRGLYFGVPNSVWELPEEPETDIPRFTQRWWLNLTQFALYVIANSFMFFQFLTILRLWDHALCVVNNSTESKMERWTPWMMAAYAVWQTWLVAANCVLQTGTVLFMASVSHLIVSVLIALAFVGFWLRLWKAMAIVTMHRSRWQTLKYSCAACCACCVGRPDDMTVPLNDASQFENVASARAKLSRFTLLAAVYTGASVIKAAIMLYQMAIAVAGCVSAEVSYAKLRLASANGCSARRGASMPSTKLRQPEHNGGRIVVMLSLRPAIKFFPCSLGGP